MPGKRNSQEGEVIMGEFDPQYFTEQDSRQLLMLLHKYALTYIPDLPQTIPALAEDLAMSQDVTDDASDFHRREIEMLWTT